MWKTLQDRGAAVDPLSSAAAALRLGLCATSFRIVIYRVIRPVNSAWWARSSTRGNAGENAVTIAPPTFSRRDEIGKLAFVLHVFQQNADEIKRTSAALGESEKQLHHAQKMEAIGNLTGGMAHDFNNLLGVIIGNLDLLGDRLKGRSDDAALLSQSALEAALRGADLTRRLLAFARQQPLQPQRIDVNKLVDGITKLLGRMLGEHIEISLDLANDLWPVVADPAHLEAAITNLATNARDAMPKGGKLIIATGNGQLDGDYAALHPEVTAGDYALIEVSDTGTGMPPEVINRIFEPFFTTKERGKGTGLGLAMVFGFMKQSGGHINVYSEVGVGTTFRLTTCRAKRTRRMPTWSAFNKFGAARRKPKAAMRPSLWSRITRPCAMSSPDSSWANSVIMYTSRPANAAAALDMLMAANDTGIDMLFTDIVMPGKLDGLGLARHGGRALAGA